MTQLRDSGGGSRYPPRDRKSGPPARDPILAAAFFAVSVQRGSLPRFSAKFGDRLSLRLESKAEHPTGDRVSFCLHLEQSGRNGIGRNGDRGSAQRIPNAQTLCKNYRAAPGACQ